MLRNTDKTIKIKTFDIAIEEWALHESKEYVQQRIIQATEEVLAKQEKRKQLEAYLNNDDEEVTNISSSSFFELRKKEKASINKKGANYLTRSNTPPAITSFSETEIFPSNDKILPFEGKRQIKELNNLISSVSDIENGSRSLTKVTTKQQLFNTVQEFSDITSSNDPITSVIKEKIKTLNYLIQKSPKNNSLIEDKEYWVNVLEKLEQGVSSSDIFYEDSDERFKEFYIKFLASPPIENKLNSLNWQETSLKMINIIKSKLLNKSEADSYWEFLIKKLQNIDIDVLELFRDHEELFFILQEALKIDNLPQTLDVYTKSKVYPKLFTTSIYAKLGRKEIYGKLLGLQLEKLDGKYWIVNKLEEVHVSIIGEKTKREDGRYPALLEGQWYDRDRIKYATNPNSSFWKAAVYNLENSKAYLYKTIAQRHAFYKFADAYLKSKGIINEWFDAAARVTTNSPFMWEVAVGGADKCTLGAVYLSIFNPNTAEFLRGGNKYLLKHNMHNLNMIIEGNGKFNAAFIDANGKEQNFEGLDKKALDLKLVEFEQSLVQEYIQSYLEKNKATSVVEAYFEEYVGDTPKEDLQEIINEINDGFIGALEFLGEDTTEIIIEKHFTKNGKASFDFASYKDRVKLGQLMIEELYYRRYRDNLLSKLEKIRRNPEYFSEKPTQEDFKPVKKDIPEKKLRFKDYYQEVKDNYERLVRAKGGFKQLVKENKEEAIRFLKRELKEIKSVSWSKIKKEIKSYYRDIEKVYEQVDHLVRNPDKIVKTMEEEYVGYIREYKRKYEKEGKEIGDMYNKGVKLYEELEDIIKNPEKHYKEGIKKVDETAEEALKTVAEQIYPDLLKVVEVENNEVKKQSLFQTNYKATVAILLYEFATGKSKEHQRRFNFNEHPFANKILEGRMLKEIMKEAVDILERDRYDFKNMPDVKEFSYKLTLDFSPELSPRSWLESLDKHFDSNLPQFFLGGSIGYFYIEKGMLIGRIDNRTSRGSLMLHIGKDYPIEQASNKQERPKLTDIEQRIYFTFDLKKLTKK